MHPLIVTPLYPPAIGGAATYFSMVAPGLVARPEIDHVTVLTECLPGEPSEWTDGKLRVLRRLPTRVSVAHRSWAARAQSYARTQWWFSAHFVALARQLSVDVIHLHTRYHGRALFAALQRSDIPVIANLHDKLTEPRSLMAVADRLLCCADSVHQFVLRSGYPAHRCVSLPLPLDVALAPTGEGVADTRRSYGLKSAPYVLFVGDITARKGVYDLLQGYQQWHAEPPAQLVFAGTNWEGVRFVRQVQRTPGAMYVGPVPRAEALQLMRGAEVVVMPSHSEAISYVILEAIALGTKVICPPDIPEYARYLADSVLPVVNAAAIARALDAAWNRTDSPAYPLAAHSPDRVMSGLANLYASVISQRATPVADRPRD